MSAVAEGGAVSRRATSGTAGAVQPNRLAAGGLVDRGRPLAFTFDGRVMTGYAGDTLASALVANGVRLVGRSFKYHRPRGILSAGPEEPNALVELGTGARREPNTRATTTELFDGLVAASQNRWPSLRFDLMAVNQLLSPLFVAGFYYKTFMWPPRLWEKLYEPAIRRAAGLGRASGEPDPDAYEKVWAHCDVLVVGAGPAGLAAALAAGRAGARVILCDEDARPGGRLLSDPAVIDGLPALDWVERALAELRSLPAVRLMTRTAVVAAYDGGVHAAVERVGDHLPASERPAVRQRLWRIVARRTVLATGAVERPMVFGGNDVPGVMLASAVRTYVDRYAAVPSRRMAVATATDDGWRTAEAAVRAGLEVVAVVDARETLPDARKAFAAANGIRVIAGAVADVTGGAGGIKGIAVESRAGGTVRLAAETLAVSGGWSPAIGLASGLGGRPAWREAIGAYVPGAMPPGMTEAGAAGGDLSLAACLSTGHARGAAAAADLGRTGDPGRPPAAEAEGTDVVAPPRVVGRGKAFVDLQHDVTAADVELAHREGYTSVEHLKRYTTLGMATDQGKTSNLAGLALMAELRGRSIPEVGTTVYRPPVVPVAIGTLAGRARGAAFKPVRLTPTHAFADEQGAVFVDAGLWKRAQYFPRPGEADWLATVTREVLAVRSGVGFCDVSTLGKVEVMGPDAGTFLDRVYVNGFSTLGIGRARYGIMLREDGFVMDDGTTARLAEDHYVVTTTTAKAGPVMQHLEFCRQVLWPELDVQLATATDQWAQLSIAGPRSRALLERVVDPATDLSNAAMPFMAAREVRLRGGMPARLFRISFSGELAYELAVPSRYGDALARRLMAAGADLGVVPYGTEALGVLRIEKGHVAGPELNGTTTAADLGFGRMMSTKKDYVGRALAGRPALTAPDRPVLVGLRPLETGRRLRSGAHIVPKNAVPGPETDQGHVTSACFSPVEGRWIGLGLVVRGRDRHGEIVRAFDPLRDEDYLVEIRDPVAYDPTGGRQRG